MNYFPDSLCLYGAGELGQLAVDFCESCGLKIVAVVDQSDEVINIFSNSGVKYSSITIDQYLNETTGFTEVEYEGEAAGDLRIKLTNLPTSATGLDPGTIYNDSGTLKVA